MLSRNTRDRLWDGTWELQTPRFSTDWAMRGLRRRPVRQWRWDRILFWGSFPLMTLAGIIGQWLHG